jgi:hypothetical protein
MRIHSQYLFDSRRAQDSDNLNKLVYIIRRNEERLADDHFDEDTSGRPHVDLSSVISSTENQLWCTITTRADIGNIRFALN